MSLYWTPKPNWTLFQCPRDSRPMHFEMVFQTLHCFSRPLHIFLIGNRELQFTPLLAESEVSSSIPKFSARCLDVFNSKVFQSISFRNSLKNISSHISPCCFMINQPRLQFIHKFVLVHDKRFSSNFKFWQNTFFQSSLLCQKAFSTLSFPQNPLFPFRKVLCTRKKIFVAFLCSTILFDFDIWNVFVLFICSCLCLRTFF